MDERVLEKILKSVTKSGKYVLGLKEVSSALKGSRAVILSASVDADSRRKIVDTCRSLAIPTLDYDGNSEKLGRLCGKPFKASVIAIKSVGDADLRELLSAAQSAA